jgi:hypothetical protein
VAPSDVDDFEALLKQCVAAAHAAKLPESHEWICYRAAGCRYDVIRFSNTGDGFATPHPFGEFIHAIARSESREALNDVEKRLAAVDVKTEWCRLFRQYSSWSPVESMTTATNPKARITEYVVKDSAISQFDRALTARTTFLRMHGYTLPVEGFVGLGSASPIAWQVVFPVSWGQYYRSDSMDAFVNRLSADDQREFQRLNRELVTTASSIEQYDADYAPELRYDTSK